MHSRSSLALLPCLLFFVASRLEAAEHTKDSLETVKEKLAQEKAVLIDVREQDEWDAGHLQGAVLLPLSQLKDAGAAEEAVKVLPKKKILYCHCKAGRRALTAGDILKKLGYDVRPLKQGYDELLKAGFPKADEP